MNMATIQPTDDLNLDIRTIGIEDLSLLFSLNCYADPDEMVNANTQLMSQNKIRIYGLFVDTTLVGELRVKFSDIDPEIAVEGARAYLYALRIHPDYRRRGFATFLIQSVISLLYDDGYFEFTIGVEQKNNPAYVLYSKLGFESCLKKVCETYQGDTYEYKLLLRKDPIGGVLNAD